MGTTESTTIIAFEDEIRLTVPAGAATVEVFLVTDDEPVPLHEHGYAVTRVDDRTVVCTPDEDHRPKAGDTFTLRVRRNRDKRTDKDLPVTVEVREAATASAPDGEADEGEAASEPQPPEPQIEISALDLQVFETACGALVLLPDAVADDALEVLVVTGAGPTRPEDEGWEVRRPDARAVELVAGAEAPRSGVLELRFPGADGERRETVRLPPRQRSAQPGVARARLRSFGGGGGNGGGNGSFGGGGEGGRFDPRSLFNIPLRVASGGTGGTTVADEGYRAWVERIVAHELPRLAHDPDATQFRASLVEATTLPGAPVAASPYVSAPPIAAVAQLAFAAGMTGGGLTSAQLAGPFATLLTETESLATVGKSAVKDLQPIVDTADLDIVASRRAMLSDAIDRFTREARRPLPDGPEIPVLATQLAAIVDLLPRFGRALGVTKPANAVSQDDFANVSRYEVLGARVEAMQAVMDQWLLVDEADPRVGVADLEQFLAVVAENARDLEIELENATLGPQERAVTAVPASEGSSGDITLARLLTWIQEEAGQNLPALLDQAGREATPLATGVLAAQSVYVKSLLGFTGFPWSHPIIGRAVEVLDDSLTVAIAQAETLQPPDPDSGA
jgi:hypothetical protein